MDSEGIVLITGLNGYLAGRVAEGVLKEGYNVRGTIRRMESGIRVQQGLYERGYEGRVEVVQVPDIAKAGAFDEAVQGIYMHLHTISRSWPKSQLVYRLPCHSTPSITCRHVRALQPCRRSDRQGPRGYDIDTRVSAEIWHAATKRRVYVLRCDYHGEGS